SYLIQSINICCNLYDKSSREIVLSQLSQVSRFSMTVSNLKKIVMCIIKRICKTELEDFELDKSADYSVGTKEGAENAILAFQLLSVYESLIEVCFSEEHMET
uniref:FANCI helical domain-containing protein n=1 Tax=Romanomermis culicivorax TaxID=13658 RepID=A0A915IKS1_ROMCU